MTQVQRKRMMMLLTIFLGMLAAIAPLSTDMYLPALPEMMEDFGVVPSMIQLTLTASMAGMALGQIVAGPISDEKGRRKPLIAGMLIFAVSSLACVFVKSIYIFLVFRFIQGCSGGAGIVIARAIARDVCKGPALTRFFSMLMLVNGLAPIIAPVIGGQILRFSEWEGVFVLLTVIGVILTISAISMTETLSVRRRVEVVYLPVSKDLKDYLDRSISWDIASCSVLDLLPFLRIFPDLLLYFKIFTMFHRKSLVLFLVLMGLVLCSAVP